MGRKAKYDWDKLLKEYLEFKYQNKTEFAQAKGINPGYFRRNTINWQEKKKNNQSDPQNNKKSKVTSRKKKNSVTKKQKKEKQLHDEKKICGARAKQTGQPCKQKAGWGTDHVGTGRCKLHGGCSPGAPKGNKYTRTHGAYETIIRDRLTEDEQAVFDAISADPKMDQEIKILRFKLLRLLDPVEKQVAMGTEIGPEIVTLQVDEVTKAYAIEKLVDGIRKIVKDTKDAIKEEDIVKIIDDVRDD